MNSITIEYSKTKDLEKKLKEHYELVAGVTIEDQIARAVEHTKTPYTSDCVAGEMTAPEIVSDSVAYEEETHSVDLEHDPVANPTVEDIIEEHKTEETQIVSEIEPAVEEAPEESVKKEPIVVEEPANAEDPIAFATKVKEWVMADRSHAPKFKEVLDKHGVGKFSPEIMTDELKADLATLIKEA